MFYIDPLTPEEKAELLDLRMQLKQLKNEETKEEEEEEGHETHSEHSSEDASDDDEDMVDSLPLPKTGNDRKPRASVSAEAFGVWNKKAEFKAPVVEKGADTTEKIRKRLSESFLFNALDDKEFDIVIGAMIDHKSQVGDVVIKEGDDGDYLYVVESGKLNCTKIFPGNTEPTHLREYVPGEAFGELALLYNAPRAATITAAEESQLWGLDRATFNNIVKDAAMKKREMYENFLKQVDLLKNMDTYERTTLADALTSTKHKPGENIINEGESGSVFFFVIEGQAVALKNIDGEQKEVKTYGPGDYFGERALIKNEPRAATI